MFTYPGTELFNKDGDRRVVWSIEEYDEALQQGWGEEKHAAEKPAPKPKAK